MPAFWPVLLVGSQVVLAADRIPQFDVRTSCRAAAQAAVSPNRNEDSCARDEEQARDKLKQDWHTFSSEAQSHCSTLAQQGGPPSYVELLTCLELDKQVNSLPKDRTLEAPDSGLHRR